jgi:glutamyl-tRNA reductase
MTNSEPMCGQRNVNGRGRWQLVMCGTSHKDASLEQREELQIAGRELADANSCLREATGLTESIIVVTCNRIEFYFVHDGNGEPIDTVVGFYQRFRRSDITSLADLFHVRPGLAAAEHLFRVAAGIDSMVLGENQILGQVKDAYSSACSVKTTGKVLHRLFHQAFRVGKQVRTDTEMGKGACSVSTAAVAMLQPKIQAIEAPRFLFVGANQMIHMAARKLSRIAESHLTFANRSPEKAANLAATYGGDSHGLDQLSQLIAQADVVISCTAATEPVITQEMLREQAEHRAKGPCILMDLAVPRDIDCPQKRGAGYQAYDLEDVRRHVEGEQNRRVQAIPQAEEIIESRLREFAYWYEHVQSDLVCSGNGHALEAARQDILAPFRNKLPPHLQGELETASRQLVERIVNIMQQTSSRVE